MNNLRIRAGDLLEIFDRIYEVKKVDNHRNIYYYYGDKLKIINKFNFYAVSKVYRKHNNRYEEVM